MVKICVIGAGVIGLSSAVRIQDRFPNIDITLIADQFSPNTTSDGAGAIFEIYAAGDTPAHLLEKWGKETLEHLTNLAYSSDAADARVTSVSGFTAGDNIAVKPFKYIPSRDLTSNEKKLFPGSRWAHFSTTFIVDCKSYLPWLMKKYTKAGGKIVVQRIEAFAELYPMYDVIVNCSGLRASQLVHDPDVFPIRGQTIRVHAPWIKHFYIEDKNGKETYIFPGSKNVVLGGTYEEGVWDHGPNEENRRDVYERCCKIVPSLKKAFIDFSWVGLRPGRKSIRLELEPRISYNKCRVIHNYGHGGAGITLHWGCASDVVNLLQEAINNINSRSKL